MSANLIDILSSYKQPDADQVDTKTLDYAIYARKSTLGDERQERSISDQIEDCVERVVKIDGLKVVETIEEKGSAKEPDIRPKFKKLLEEIKSGRIDGIITWHPDRLARNMKEAGEIIDLLDKGILRDLKFATSTFENSPTGKMLLGVSFVLSKQYSEHLSESVSRGNRRLTEDGVFLGKMKHGYSINNKKELRPDNWFKHILTAFQMRIEGHSQADIAKYLNKTDYKVRKRGKDPESYKWSKNSISSLLSDPVYAGVLKYGDNLVQLTSYTTFSQL